MLKCRAGVKAGRFSKGQHTQAREIDDGNTTDHERQQIVEFPAPPTAAAGQISGGGASGDGPRADEVARRRNDH